MVHFTFLFSGELILLFHEGIYIGIREFSHILIDPHTYIVDSDLGSDSNYEVYINEISWQHTGDAKSENCRPYDEYSDIGDPAPGKQFIQ